MKNVILKKHVSKVAKNGLKQVWHQTQYTSKSLLHYDVQTVAQCCDADFEAEVGLHCGTNA